MRAEVWVGGRPLSTLCFYDQVTWTKKWPFGDWSAGFRVHARPRWRSSYLRRDTEVVIKYGAGRRFLGDIGSWDRETGEVSVRGRIRAGEGYLASSFDLITAINGAISGTPPLNWRVDEPSIPVGEVFGADHEPTYLLDLLAAATALGANNGAQFMMGPDGRLRFVERPTTPSWQVWPEAVDLGEAGGPDRATSVQLRFINSTAVAWAAGGVFALGDVVTYAGTFWTALVSTPGSTPGSDDTEWADGGPLEAAADSVVAEDLTVTPYRQVQLDAVEYGAMVEASAQAMADAALAKLLEPVYLNDVPANPLLVATWGGEPINPLTVEAGTLGRVWGASHPRLGHPYVDLLAGEVTVSDAETPTPKTLIKGYQKPLTNLVEFISATAPRVTRNLTSI